MMRKTLTLFSLLFISASLCAQTMEEVEAYINRYKQLAMDAQVNFGIPAAVTLAQGIHESSCGKSMLATEANNHFGIKCKSTWRGETILHDDDAKQECFRRYAKAEDSYLDHSHFLKDQTRYHFLFDIKLTDYKGWASGLKRAGYATNPAYVTRLTDLIERYNLQQYTYEALKQTFGTTPGEVVPAQDKSIAGPASNNGTKVAEVSPSTSASPSSSPNPVSSVYFKGLKGFWAKKGQTLQDKAFEFNIRYPRLLLLNDLADAPLEHDQFIFIEKKRKVGPEEYHIVKEGEDMHLISQREAMALDNLYLFNNLRPGQEPITGERLNLQYKSYTTPKIIQVVSTIINTNVERPVVEERKVEPKKVEVPEPVKQEPKTVVKEESFPRTPEPTFGEGKVIPPVVSTVEKEQKPVIQTKVQPTLVEESRSPQSQPAKVETITQPTIVETKVIPKPVQVETRVQPTLIEEAPKPPSNVIVTERIIKPAIVDTNRTASITPSEQVKTEQPIVIEIKEERKTIVPVGNSPIIDEVKAKKVEELLAPEQKGEVAQLSEQQKIEQAEKERKQKELQERNQKTEAYAKSVTDRMDEERRKQEALQDEEQKKRRLIEEEERKRIDQEQKERDRLEEEARLKAEKVQLELQAQQQKIKEEEALRVREEEARSKRVYNEPGTSDTIRGLKKKWDAIVYRSLPERKPLFVTPQDTSAKTATTPPAKESNGKAQTVSGGSNRTANPQAKKQQTEATNNKGKNTGAQSNNGKSNEVKSKTKGAKPEAKKTTGTKETKTGNKKEAKSKDNKPKDSAKKKKADPKKKR